MPAPGIGVRQRWAPQPSTAIDWSHPLAPTDGWIPSLGDRSIHGHPLIVENNGTAQSYGNPTAFGIAHAATSNDARWRWPSQVRGTRNNLTAIAFQRHVAVPDYYSTYLLARGGSDGISTTGPTITSDGGSMVWCHNWNDNAGWQYTDGPDYSATQEMLCCVYRATVVEWWLNGKQEPINDSETLAAINFDNQTHWNTGDSAGSRSMLNPISARLVYDRALDAAEIAALWADPFCFMRR